MRILALSIAVVMLISISSALSAADKTNIEKAAEKLLSSKDSINYVTALFGSDGSLDITIIPTNGYSINDTESNIRMAIGAATIVYVEFIHAHPDIGRMDLSVADDNKEVISTLYCDPEWAKVVKTGQNGVPNQIDLALLYVKVFVTAKLVSAGSPQKFGTPKDIAKLVSAGSPQNVGVLERNAKLATIGSLQNVEVLEKNAKAYLEDKGYEIADVSIDADKMLIVFGENKDMWDNIRRDLSKPIDEVAPFQPFGDMVWEMLCVYYLTLQQMPDIKYLIIESQPENGETYAMECSKADLIAMDQSTDPEASNDLMYKVLLSLHEVRA